LGLAVRDLRDNRASNRGARSRGLGLTVRDLRDNGRSDRGARSRSLGLSIADLRDDWARSRSWARCRSLGLAIADLRDHGGSGWAGRRSLRLTVGNLRDTRSRDRSNLGLTIADLRSTATTLVHSSDVDGDALSTGALAVQVVESTGEALVPDSGSSTARGGECERAIATNGESSGFTGTCLKGSIELEPVFQN
jgi:hypothetical protein